MQTAGRLTLTATSPVQTFTEVLTETEVRHFLGLPERSTGDASESALLEAFVIGAREVAEILQDCDLVPKQWDLTLDTLPDEIQLRKPLSTVDLFKYRDSGGTWTTMVENTDYIVDTARGLVMPPYGESWPSFTAWPSSAVLVRHTSGYSATDAFWSDAGARLKIGMRQLISHWYAGRLPFETGASAAVELPFTVSALMGYGHIPGVR